MDVDIENFKKMTLFQRATQLKNFRILSHLFLYINKGFMKTTDKRACVPLRAKRNIVLALGGLEISLVL
jgi:hypothetical protein